MKFFYQPHLNFNFHSPIEIQIADPWYLAWRKQDKWREWRIEMQNEGLATWLFLTVMHIQNHSIRFYADYKDWRATTHPLRSYKYWKSENWKTSLRSRKAEWSFAYAQLLEQIMHNDSLLCSHKLCNPPFLRRISASATSISSGKTFGTTFLFLNLSRKT
jgi:hypothetical protein